jgi:hypothetical protein
MAERGGARKNEKSLDKALTVIIIIIKEGLKEQGGVALAPIGMS